MELVNDETVLFQRQFIGFVSDIGQSLSQKEFFFFHLRGVLEDLVLGLLQRLKGDELLVDEVDLAIEEVFLSQNPQAIEFLDHDMHHFALSVAVADHFDVLFVEHEEHLAAVEHCNVSLTVAIEPFYFVVE